MQMSASLKTALLQKLDEWIEDVEAEATGIQSHGVPLWLAHLEQSRLDPLTEFNVEDAPESKNLVAGEKSSEDGEAEWPCHKCTYLNPPSLLTCKLCETGRPTTEWEIIGGKRKKKVIDPKLVKKEPEKKKVMPILGGGAVPETKPSSEKLKKELEKVPILMSPKKAEVSYCAVAASGSGGEEDGNLPEFPPLGKEQEFEGEFPPLGAEGKKPQSNASPLHQPPSPTPSPSFPSPQILHKLPELTPSEPIVLTRGLPESLKEPPKHLTIPQHQEGKVSSLWDGNQPDLNVSRQISRWC